MVVLLVLPEAGAGALAELCRRVEAAGADSLWAVDHLFLAPPINECLTTLAVAAAATERPDPGQLHPSAPTAPALGRGQTGHLAPTLGRGTVRIWDWAWGSTPTSTPGPGSTTTRRGRLMDSRHRRRCTTPGPAPRRIRQPGICTANSPPSPRVPLWMGGTRRQAGQRAAAVGDASIPLFLSVDEYRPAPRRACAVQTAAGRAPTRTSSTPGRGRCSCTSATTASQTGTPTGGESEWLSELYGLPTKAFHRHLVAGPSRTTCAAPAATAIVAGGGPPRHRHGGRHRRPGALGPRTAPPSPPRPARQVRLAPFR